MRRRRGCGPALRRIRGTSRRITVEICCGCQGCGIEPYRLNRLRRRQDLPLRDRHRRPHRHRRPRRRPRQVSYGSPGDVAANGGIVVVEVDGRNFSYWHVAPPPNPAATCPYTDCSATSPPNPKTGATSTSPNPPTTNTASTTETRSGRAPSAPSTTTSHPRSTQSSPRSHPPQAWTRRLLRQSTRQHTNRRQPAETARLARPARHPNPHPLAPHPQHLPGRAAMRLLRRSPQAQD
jgi:hypothetical protein